MRVSQEKYVVPFAYQSVPFSPDDVISLRSAFARCDTALLAQAVVQAKSPNQDVNYNSHSALFAAIDKAIETMLCQPMAFQQKQTRLIAPFGWYDALPNDTTYHYCLGAALYNPNDYPDADRACECINDYVFQFDEIQFAQQVIADETYSSYCSWNNLLTSLTPLMYQPWSETLSQFIWLPGSLPAKQQHRILADVFWAMTYFGFDEPHSSRTGETAFICNCVKPDELADTSLCFAQGRMNASNLGSSCTKQDKAFSERMVAVLNFNAWIDALRIIALAHHIYNSNSLEGAQKSLKHN